ncbi:protein cholesin [Erethizon dorsatum]
MVKQKRTGPEVTKKKSKKPKKVSVEEILRAADATADEEEAGLEGVVVSRVQDTVPQLSPEEKRVLERKLKKERRKEEKKKLREARVSTVQTPAKRSGAELALDYLSGWAQKLQSWRFQKTRQTWLLLNMYDSNKVPEEHFPTLLAYLEGLQGKARELTLQKAEALMQELDVAGSDAALQEKAPRLRQVLQLLS